MGLCFFELDIFKGVIIISVKVEFIVDCDFNIFIMFNICGEVVDNFVLLEVSVNNLNWIFIINIVNWIFLVNW